MKKEKIKNIVLIIVVAVISSTITSFATSNYLYDSIDVKYDNSNGVQAETVQGAIDELYSCASDYSGIDTRLTSVEGYFDKETLTIDNSNDITKNPAIFINSNSDNKGVLYYDVNDDKTILAAYDSSGRWGKGTLELRGNPVQINGESLSDTGWITGTTGVDYRVKYGVCYIRTSNITVSNGSYTTLFTLPSNYRPSSHVYYLNMGKSDGTMWVLNVSANGAVSAVAVGSSSVETWFSLNSFPIN